MTYFHIFSGTRLYQAHDIFVKLLNYVQYRLRVCSTGRGCTVQAEGNSLRCILQPVYCTPSACLLHTLTLYTTHPHPVYCTPSPCILHTLTLYTAHTHPVYCTPSPCTAHMYLIQGGPVGLTSYIYMYGGDLDAFGKPVHKDCFQKCIVTYLKFTGGF